MATYATTNTHYFLHAKNSKINSTSKTNFLPFHQISIQLKKPRNFCSYNRHFHLSTKSSANHQTVEAGNAENEEEKRKFKWVDKIGSEVTESQKQAIARLPPKMSKRCKAVMRQIICFSPQKGSLSDLLKSWVRIMKPSRADWLAVLKELRSKDNPLYIEVAEIALLEESFEPNVRDYTKVIDYYGTQNRVQDAENTLLAMKTRAFAYDQVTLTTMINIYSKSGDLFQAQKAFEEIKQLGSEPDKRSYGAIIMAHIRAGRPEHGEKILEEMDRNEIYAGSEVYKALLRAYSMAGDSGGAQRVFSAVQLAGIVPDEKLCGLLINAYRITGQSEKARIVFENMRKAGIEPSDKCIALMLDAYEKENRVNTALELLIDLERESVMIGKESSEILVRWFRRLGVVEEVDLVLQEYAATKTHS